MEEKVSIIIPVLNRENLILRCLDSILAQTHLPDEVIIVDNGSIDKTVSVAEKWRESNYGKIPAIKILHQSETGAPKARQMGFENSTSDLVIFFDSDDEMKPMLIEKATAEFERDQNLELLCWRSEIIQLDGRKMLPARNWTRPLESHLIHAMLHPQGHMVKRSLLEKSGAWKTNLSVWNDYEYGLRLLLSQPKMKGLDDVLVTIYSQRESITGISFSSKKGKWEATLRCMRETVRKKAGEPDKLTSDMDNIDRMLNYREMVLASAYAREGDKRASKELKDAVLTDRSFYEKLLLNFVYYYISLGGRGTWRIIRKLYLR